MIFVLDNYDSFTYNLVQYIGELGAEVEVRRNDQVTVSQVENMRPERIVISPGPCTPHEAGISIESDPPLRRQSSRARGLPRTPGHRRSLRRTRGPRRSSHAWQDQRRHARQPNCLSRSSHAHDRHALSFAHRRGKRSARELEVSAWTTEKDGTRTIMGLRHRNHPVEGVQFHPESVLTDAGKKLVANFLNL